MRFFRPEILWFLFALAVPVIIHLLKLHRYKREYFSNVRLLEQIQQEQKRSSKLREMLVLAARMLTMAAVVFAFAQPYIPVYQNQGSVGSQTRVSIYLDNSFSMQAPAKEAILMEKGRQQAERILQAFPPDASVQVFTNDFSGREQNFSRPAEALEYLKEVDYSPVARTFGDIVQFQKQCFEQASVPEASRLCYYISDFQKWAFDGLSARNWGDSQTRYVFVPLEGTGYDNISLDSLSLDIPVLQAGREMGLQVFLTNRSEKEQLQVPLRLYVQDVQTGVYPVDFKPNERVTVRIPFLLEQSGLYSCYAEIADFPVEFDNRLYFSLRVEDRSQVLQIYADRPDASLKRLFDGEERFVYKEHLQSKVNYEDIPASGLVVLYGLSQIPSALQTALEKYVREGGSLAVVPPVQPPGSAAAPEDRPSPLDALMQALTGSSYGSYTSEEQRIRYINFKHPVFALAVEGKTNQNLLPQVKSAYGLPEAGHISYTPLMCFSDGGASGGSGGRNASPGADFLRVYAVDKGLLYLFSSDIGETNTDFARHYSFVVAFLNMALFQGSGPMLYYEAGTKDGVFYPSSQFRQAAADARYYLVNAKSGESLLPQVRRIGSETAFYFYGQVQQAGNYLLTDAPVDTAAAHRRALQAVPEALQALSFNFNRRESRKDCYTPRELSVRIKEQNARCFLMNPDKTDLAESVQQMNKGRELWKVFVILALVFILAETVLLRCFRVEKRKNGEREKRTPITGRA